VQKLLSRAGVASRRDAEELMRRGRVRVNGVVVTTLGTRVVPGKDRVEVDGEPVRIPDVRWIMLHKPAGTLTTTRDPRGRRTVYDLLPPDLADLGLSYVGRLDADTEGLLLLTNDGDVANRLLHPSGEVEREYEVGVSGVPAAQDLRALLEGVELDDGPAAAREVSRIGTETAGSVLRMILVEGRKREVRRLCDAVGHPVRWLRRVRFGPVRLGDLPTASWRNLTSDEIRSLRERGGKGSRREG
jgi:23S rRNA pseudouridine2605 synthase